jgi:dCMP deaminase
MYLPGLRRIRHHMGRREGQEVSEVWVMEYNTNAFWLRVAGDVSRNADCRRRRVGAVIVNVLGRQIATGSNAVPSGPGCMAGGCPRGLLTTEQVPHGADYKSGPGLCHAVHAEAAAIRYAFRSDRLLDGSTLYCTDRPCADCSRIISTAGIARVVTPGGAYSVGEEETPDRNE